VRPSKDSGKAARQAFAPDHIETQRKKMIQQVVTRGDAAEHFAHLTRGGRFVVGSCGTGAGQAGARGTKWAHGRIHVSRSRWPRTSATSLGATGPKVSALPILRVKTRRKFPARVFLSECMISRRRAGLVAGKVGSGPRRRTSCSIRAALSGARRPIRPASRDAA